MGRRRGDRIAVRWKVVDELTGTSELRRYRLVEEDGKEAMELVELQASARLRPGAEHGLLAAARDWPSHPAVLPRQVLVSAEGAVVLQPPTQGTLADRRGKLGAERAIHLLGWLGPAVVLDGVRHLGRLRPEDVAVDSNGVPRLAPSGTPSPSSSLDRSRFTAPEVLAGSAPTPASGLYGLGVILYKGLAETWPLPSTQGSSSPPSAFRPAVTPEADRLVMGLLSLRPEERLETLNDLPPLPPDPPVVEVSLPISPRTTALSGQPQSQAVLQPRGRHMVVVDVKNASPSRRFLVMALTGLGSESLNRAVARGREVVVARYEDEQEAVMLGERLGALGFSARVTDRIGGGRAPLWVLSSLAFLAALLAVLVNAVVGLALATLGVVFAALAATRPPAVMLAEGKRGMWGQATPHGRALTMAGRLLDPRLPDPLARDLVDDLHRLHGHLLSLGAARSKLVKTGRGGAERQKALGQVERELEMADDVLSELEQVLTMPVELDMADPDTVGGLKRRVDAIRATRREIEGAPR